MFGLFGKKNRASAAQQDQNSIDLDGDNRYADGMLSRRFFAAVDRAVRAQDSSIDKYVAGLRKKNPSATNAELQAKLDKHFRNLATASGAGNGGIAALPGLGTAVSLVTISGEGILIVEVCALYALASAKLRNIDTTLEEVRRALVLLAVAGGSGNDVLRAVAEQNGIKSIVGLRSLKNLPKGELIKVNSTLGKLAMRTLRRRFGGAMFKKLMPFGIGAVLGAKANRKIADRMIGQVQQTLGPVDASAGSSEATNGTDSAAGSEQ
ncbi:hypothetical protein [Corynebacterium heidelbergense]|uniref:EcsC family protein n=1 Tax=Corynebacterium heidelbergense TaxID=2055947 RepID=A0A364V7S3_9CORY|nr:hypothetical protein [Corynebacterium heidelbergense]RAV32695.1 hypothetical protein DLJ54_02220 [Corynebacterium heidelbergense]